MDVAGMCRTFACASARIAGTSANPAPSGSLTRASTRQIPALAL
jgi:hypothetical protein